MPYHNEKFKHRQTGVSFLFTSLGTALGGGSYLLLDSFSQIAEQTVSVISSIDNPIFEAMVILGAALGFAASKSKAVRHTFELY